MESNKALAETIGKTNVQYADGVTVPKRSRQFVWRAGVEMCKTASQLALQVINPLQNLSYSLILVLADLKIFNFGP